MNKNFYPPSKTNTDFWKIAYCIIQVLLLPLIKTLCEKFFTEFSAREAVLREVDLIRW